MNDIIYANQIFIEHRSQTKLISDLNKFIDGLNEKLIIERVDKERIETEYDIYKSFSQDTMKIYKVDEVNYHNEIGELKKKNIWHWVITISATITTILVVTK